MRLIAGLAFMLFSMTQAPSRVKSVTISPDSLKLEVGDSGMLKAVVKNQFGDTVKRVVSWSIPSTDTAFISLANIADRSVTAVAKKAGAARIIATVGGIKDTAYVTVVSSVTLVTIALQPSMADLAAGATQQFTALATWTDGMSHPFTATWSATGGTITQAGLYTAGQVGGNYQVIASTSGKSAIAQVTVQAPPTLTAVVISPSSATTATETQYNFTATAQWTDGQVHPITFSWSATGGTITSSGVYTAGSTAGSYRVIVAASGKADTASINITPPVSSSSCVRIIYVSTASGLINAANSALPGDCIQAAAGTYSLGFTQIWTKSGTATQPITLEGVGNATILTPGSGNTIAYRGSYWHIRKLRITNGFFGIQFENSSYSVVDSVEIDHTQNHAIHLGYGTDHSVVKNSYIHDTGLGDVRYGEGIYVGGYSCQGCSTIDTAANDNQVINNRFGPNVSAEPVDMSDGSHRTIVTGNIINGSGTISVSGQTNAAVDVRGFDNVINDNIITLGTGPSDVKYGMEQYNGPATYHRNTVTNVPGGYYGFRRLGGTATVYCDNTMTLLGVTCTP